MSTSFLLKANMSWKEGRRKGREGGMGKGQERKYFFFSTPKAKPQNKVRESSLLMYTFMKAVQNF